MIADGKVHREFLKPGNPPEAKFEISAQNIVVREHCNIHGLWKG